VSKTYQVVSEESAQHGDFADQGFEYQDKELTLRELVDELEYFLHTSEPQGEATQYTWVISDSEQCFRTGDYTSYGLHLTHEPTKREIRIWTAVLDFLFKKG
jgi:hypothetical protein